MRAAYAEPNRRRPAIPPVEGPDKVTTPRFAAPSVDKVKLVRLFDVRRYVLGDRP